MTETRRNRVQRYEDFAREALSAVHRIRASGVCDPQEIAMALNREGFPNYHGHQWNGETIADFLGDPKVEAIACRMGR